VDQVGQVDQVTHKVIGQNDFVPKRNIAKFFKWRRVKTQCILKLPTKSIWRAASFSKYFIPRELVRDWIRLQNFPSRNLAFLTTLQLVTLYLNYFLFHTCDLFSELMNESKIFS